MINISSKTINALTVLDEGYRSQAIKLKNNYDDFPNFFVNSNYTFEIGGLSKTRKQIKGVPNSFIVKDNIEVGYENVIPIWLFGLLY